MKKVHLTFLFFVLCSLTAYSQPQMNVALGIKAGGNFTGQMFEKGASVDGSRKLIPNFHIGGIIDIPLTTAWKIQPEIQFLRGGYKSSFTNNRIKNDTIHRISYLNMPIAINYYFRDINVEPYISFGPYWGYALGGSTKSVIKEIGKTTKSSQSIDFNKNHLKRFDAGFMLGVGMDLDFFSLEFKYSQSILNRYSGPNDSVYSVNMNLALSLIVFL